MPAVDTDRLERMDIDRRKVARLFQSPSFMALSVPLQPQCSRHLASGDVACLFMVLYAETTGLVQH